jgi:hypothetical protein
LIYIPYWWNLSMKSLKATLYKFRPDLFFAQPEGAPIPEKRIKGLKNQESSSVAMTPKGILFFKLN